MKVLLVIDFKMMTSRFEVLQKISSNNGFIVRLIGRNKEIEDCKVKVKVIVIGLNDVIG